MGPKLLQQGLVYNGRGVDNMRRIGKTNTYMYLHRIMNAMIWCPVVPSVLDAAVFQENFGDAPMSCLACYILMVYG